MIELLSLLGGGIFRLLTEVLNLFKAKSEAEHELKMTQLQLDADKARAALQLDIIHANNEAQINQADLQALSSALEGQNKSSGIKWVDALSSSVRPVLTYWWCLVLYTVSKGFLLYAAYTPNTALSALAPLVLTEFDYSIVSSMISFWFVDRAIIRAKK
jgi:hypothetical protein